MDGQVGVTNFFDDLNEEQQNTLFIVRAGFFGIPWQEVQIITDKELQKKGLDVIAKEVKFEFKIVRYNSGIGAITIETHSDLYRSGPLDGFGDGWITKPLECDYLVWAFKDCAYIWPFLELQKWFLGQDPSKWEAFDTPNSTYKTRTRKVPFDDIPIEPMVFEYGKGQVKVENGKVKQND